MLYSIEWEGAPPSLEEVRERFGLEQGEVDEGFGAVAIDPDASLYAILVEDSAVERLRGERADEAAAIEGPYANPLIEPFGPPEPGDAAGAGEDA